MSDPSTVDDVIAGAGFTRVPPSEYRLGPVNAHDAEEQLRPYLGEVVEEERMHEATMAQWTPLEQAYEAALDKALELLRVQR